MHNKTLLAERILLNTLGFDLQLVHPYRACLDKIKDALRCTYIVICDYFIYFYFSYRFHFGFFTLTDMTEGLRDYPLHHTVMM